MKVTNQHTEWRIWTVQNVW